MTMSTIWFRVKRFFVLAVFVPEPMKKGSFFYVSIEFLIVFCVGPANSTKQEKDSRIHKSKPKTKREALTSTTDYYVVAQWLFNLLRPNSVFLRG